MLGRSLLPMWASGLLLVALLVSGTAGAADLAKIKKSGVLRILVPANLEGSRFLPRRGSPVGAQEDVAQAFARAQGLKPVLVPVEQFRDMIPALVAGQGDLLVANLTVTDARRKKIAFSLPLAHIREQVLVRAEDKSISKPKDLDGLRIMVARGSTFWDGLNWLKKNKYPALELLARPKDLQDEDELDLLAVGEIDATLRDSNVAEMYMEYRDDIRVAFNFSSKRSIAWGVSKDAPKLLAALNRFLQLEHMTGEQRPVSKADLDEIKKKKVLRVLMRNNAASYFLYRGELLGFEYEMAKAFAKKLKLRLEVVVPPGNIEMMTWLRDGYGDMAVGFLEPLQSRRDLGLEFSEVYHQAPMHIVVREDSNVDSLEGLQGRNLLIRQSSGYWDSMVEVQKQGAGFNLVAAPDDLETEDLIAMVGRGDTDATVADEHLLDIAIVQGEPVKSAFTQGKERQHAVAVRKNNTQLLAALNKFIKANRKGLLYNILYKKYFKNKRSIRKLAGGRIKKGNAEELSKWDALTKKYANRYGFDWRLLIAQMYQESRFDPKAKSFAGALGLMQVMPRTAKGMGFEEFKTPEQGIHAGVKYLDWLRDRFDDSLPFSERMWFTLASYNAGTGHVNDARRLAKQKGWDHNRWFGHTERAMPLLSRKEYAKKARYGYIRGSEPVNYVRDIRDRFQAYVDVIDANLSMQVPSSGRVKPRP